VCAEVEGHPEIPVAFAISRSLVQRHSTDGAAQVLELSMVE
jgi:hypothetical protein